MSEEMGKAVKKGKEGWLFWFIALFVVVVAAVTCKEQLERATGSLVTISNS